MKLQKQPNNWSCLPAAFAMCLNKPLEELLTIIGHDGSEIWWGGNLEPLNRRSFHIQEMIDVCFWYNYAVIEIQPSAWSAPQGALPRRIYNLKSEKHRMKNYMEYSGVMTNQLHAVAWDGSKIYDPRGDVREFDFEIEFFFIVMNLNYC